MFFPVTPSAAPVSLSSSAAVSVPVTFSAISLTLTVTVIATVIRHFKIWSGISKNTDFGYWKFWNVFQSSPQSNWSNVYINAEMKEVLFEKRTN